MLLRTAAVTYMLSVLIAVLNYVDGALLYGVASWFGGVSFTVIAAHVLGYPLNSGPAAEPPTAPPHPS